MKRLIEFLRSASCRRRPSRLGGRNELAKTIAAIESDGGTFKFRGFGFTGSDSWFAVVNQISTLFKALGVPGLGHNVDGSRYFWYHHTEADNVDTIDPKELGENVAAMAIMAYVLADLPAALPRGGKAVGRGERAGRGWCAVRDRPRTTAGPHGGVPPVGGAPAADLRGRPARVPGVPRRDARRRLH